MATIIAECTTCPPPLHAEYSAGAFEKPWLLLLAPLAWQRVWIYLRCSDASSAKDGPKSMPDVEANKTCDYWYKEIKSLLCSPSIPTIFSEVHWEEEFPRKVNTALSTPSMSNTVTWILDSCKSADFVLFEHSAATTLSRRGEVVKKVSGMIYCCPSCLCSALFTGMAKVLIASYTSQGMQGM